MTMRHRLVGGRAIAKGDEACLIKLDTLRDVVAHALQSMDGLYAVAMKIVVAEVHGSASTEFANRKDEEKLSKTGMRSAVA